MEEIGFSAQEVEALEREFQEVTIPLHLDPQRTRGRLNPGKVQNRVPQTLPGLP